MDGLRDMELLHSLLAYVGAAGTRLRALSQPILKWAKNTCEIGFVTCQCPRNPDFLGLKTIKFAKIAVFWGFWGRGPIEILLALELNCSSPRTDRNQVVRNKTAN